MAQKYVNMAAALQGGECGDVVGSKRESGCVMLGDLRSGCLAPSFLADSWVCECESLCKKKKMKDGRELSL